MSTTVEVLAQNLFASGLLPDDVIVHLPFAVDQPLFSCACD